ncbi:serine/threonine-protein kinase [Chitinophaga sp. CF418]|uniref:serine/threonine-protein kinase n=1 Tax=Chitinophaga sp. CF418 TaxID=1855287 RepID=UPI000924214F|nr:protein kinase [Chitinophaga sp. CF418]SHM37010.1 Protein kinase domain-containing protein [Chitinophaga sp. CF418]
MSDSIYTTTASYRNIFAEHGLQYVKRDIWLEVGRRTVTSGWQVFISVIKAQTVRLLRELLPVLVNLKVPFRVVCEPMMHHYLNMGRYGRDYIGRVFTLYPATEQQLATLITILKPLLLQYKGPRVERTHCLGPSLYTAFFKVVRRKNGHKLWQLDKGRKLPVFSASEEIEFSPRTRWVIGGYYVRIKTLKNSPKGSIYKAISLKGFRFERCIIKQGRLNMVDDYAGRTIRDRLLWQKKVLTDLHKILPVPMVLDFVDENGDCYLVMEFMEGVPLDKWVEKIYQQSVWNGLSVSAKLRILTYYMRALFIIEKIHENGYVHRDIKHGNFTVAADESPVLLDFELAWSSKDRQPEPTFVAMDVGYKPPEQLNNAIPTIKEDIYACGGLLLYLLTSVHPGLFSTVTVSILKEKGIEKDLINIILNCRNEQSTLRPSISEVIGCIKAFLQSHQK